MKIKNLLIIGNGFDLAHSLETDYKSFIKNHLIDEGLKKGFITIQKENVVNNPNYKLKNNISNQYKNIETKNYFLSRLLNEFNLINWVDIEKLYFKILTEEKYDVKKLNEEFSLIKKELEIYLTSVSKERTGNHMYQFFDGLATQKENELMILNFNYTEVFQRMYADSFKEPKIINIHGQLNSPNNPIVFGYAPTDIETINLINKGDNDYLKNIKKYYYKRTDSELQLNQFLVTKYKKDIHVHILGHSCGTSDRNILKQIFTNESVKKINIMYHENYDNYFNTLVNIERVIGNSSQYAIINNFGNSIRMPQLSEDEKNRRISNQTITNFFNQKNNPTRGIDIR
ncbi:MAG: AbiH family protein [Flavobacteriaceae bacterium]